MARSSFTSWQPVTQNATANVTISPSAGLFVFAAGSVVVGPRTVVKGGGTLVNFGSVAAGTILDLEVAVIGSGTTGFASLIALY